MLQPASCSASVVGTMVGGFASQGRRSRWTAATATFCSGISSSSLCCGQRWAGRHGGVVGWTMVIFDVEERWTRRDANHGWEGVALRTRSLSRWLLGHWNRSPGYEAGGGEVSASDKWWSWSRLKRSSSDGDYDTKSMMGWVEADVARRKVWICSRRCRVISFPAEHKSCRIRERRRGEGQLVIYMNIRSWRCCGVVLLLKLCQISFNKK